MFRLGLVRIRSQSSSTDTGGGCSYQYPHSTRTSQSGRAAHDAKAIVWLPQFASVHARPAHRPRLRARPDLFCRVQLKTKGGAMIVALRSPQLAPVIFDDDAAEREAHAGAFRFSREEGVEDGRGRNPNRL